MKRIIVQVVRWDGEIGSECINWNDETKSMLLDQIDDLQHGEGTIFIIVDEYMKEKEEKKK